MDQCTVTFVAMGNGAPDLSANISAIRSGQVALSAGAFTGAAMFVQCVVASEVAPNGWMQPTPAKAQMDWLVLYRFGLAYSFMDWL
eukprot:919412-Pelagomonas_calceolata.AAC.4